MADTIGGYSFIALHGEIDENGREVEEITRPYTDGRAFRIKAINSGATELIGIVDQTSMANVAAAVTAYKLLTGTIVTISRDGVNYTNRIVLAAVPKSRSQGAVGVGGINNGKCLLEMAFTIQYAGAS